MRRLSTDLAAAVCTFSLLSTPTGAQEASPWNWGVELYGWLPDIEGTAANGATLEIPIEDILENLDFTLQGTVSATRGDWLLFADAVYLNMGTAGETSSSRSIGRFGRLDLEVDAEVGLKSFISTVGGGYRFYEDQTTALSVLGGVRYTYLEVDIDTDVEGSTEFEIFGREFGREARRALDIKKSGSNWDAIIGLQGKTQINGNWALSYYGDIGTGDSDLTWQVSAGVSYSFENYDLTLRYRHMEYDFSDDAALDELTISGPQIGIRFTF